MQCHVFEMQKKKMLNFLQGVFHDAFWRTFLGSLGNIVWGTAAQMFSGWDVREYI
jgi:hypothetical protein